VIIVQVCSHFPQIRDLSRVPDGGHMLFDRSRRGQELTKILRRFAILFVSSSGQH
jgi:hypothetical protein